MVDDIVEGLPSANFLPLAKYRFKRLVGLASVTLPVRGSYPTDGPFSGDYNICPSPGVILFGTLTQVMLALGKYPTLSPEQRFILAGLELDGQDIIITGRVVELLNASVETD